ncbi:hypothetical protein [Serratia entomophila]|uniref:hypothetical protein n=1 Tax=Serratia entomophila TaxID=42906 RepID=UPI002178A1C0|nr:hypothetical protein [Serratia entomophila]CAI1103782.1 Uncharacterised protein [Serratia entomophila]CAI1771037.1 Uncharacterised protein [Serratia entomophila]CAI1798027.1 Uncharacterised protein [Serratia entomophila]CAI1824364.1 Uncharacterised protein [Serratia entomophila]CAI1918000.1 Uncharacterised protein [Serratia entomophila]
MDVDVHTYQIICESQFTISVQISKYAWGYPLITLSDNGEFTVVKSTKRMRLANKIPVEVLRFANNYAVAWDNNRKHIYYSKAGRLYSCALEFSYVPKKK